MSRGQVSLSVSHGEKRNDFLKLRRYAKERLS